MRRLQSSEGSLTSAVRPDRPTSLLAVHISFGLQEAEGGPITPEIIAAALTDELSVGFGSASVVRTADLDTFDRRLGTRVSPYITGRAVPDQRGRVESCGRAI